MMITGADTQNIKDQKGVTFLLINLIHTALPLNQIGEDDEMDICNDSNTYSHP